MRRSRSTCATVGNLAMTDAEPFILDPGVWCFTMHATVWVSTQTARYWDHLVRTENLHFTIQPPPSYWSDPASDDYEQIGTIRQASEAP